MMLMLNNFLGLYLVHFPCFIMQFLGWNSIHSGGTLSQNDPSEKLISLRHFLESLVMAMSTEYTESRVVFPSSIVGIFHYGTTPLLHIFNLISK